MRSLGSRLLLAVTLPLALVAVIGTGYAWRRTDGAVREKTRNDAVGLAEFVATSFSAVDEAAARSPPRVAHRAVTNAVRSSWSAMKLVTGLRIVGGDGQVRWSRNIEEEDRPWKDAGRLLAVTAGRANFSTPTLPWVGGGGGEVVYPLGGAGCGGCHTGDATMRTGVLQLTVDEPALRSEVAHVFSDALWFVGFMSVLLSGVVVLVVRTLVSSRITRLAAVMKRVEEGDLVVRAPPLGDDELGDLARAYNRMLATLTEFKVTEIDTQRDLENARVQLELKRELERRVDELQILFDLARTIAATLDLNEILTRVAEVVPARMGVTRFSLMLINAEGLLEVLKAHPANVGSEGLTFSEGEGICGLAAERREVVYVPDLSNEPRFLVRGNTGPLGSLLSVPMSHGGELLGVLNFERAEKNGFTTAEIEFFTAVADHTAMAVQNARLHEQTVAMSVTDPLTGIANRRHLFQQLEAELSRARRYDTRLSLVMIDIDHFKHLNDSAGHRAGDDVLKQVCALLKRSIRKVDTLARYGGEEFVILLPQVTPEDAKEVAEKLRAAVADTSLEHGRSQPGGRVTISLGVATFPNDAQEQPRLIDCADSALYASKRGGRNRTTAYAPGMELHPGRERGPHAQRRRTGETPIVRVKE